MNEFYEFDPPKEGDAPQLPPMFSCQLVELGKDPLDEAVASASSGDVGTVFYSNDSDTLSLAITLGPEVKKSQALQVHYVMMLGLSDALGALAPPEIEISHLWPNLVFMNRGLMGKTILLDSGGDRDKIPEWMVVGLRLRLKVESKKLHQQIEMTSLEDEGASFLSNIRIIEAIVRHFLSWLNTWQDEGFKPVHSKWSERIVEKITVNDVLEDLKGEWISLDDTGLALFKAGKNHYSKSLLEVDLTK